MHARSLTGETNLDDEKHDDNAEFAGKVDEHETKIKKDKDVGCSSLRKKTPDEKNLANRRRAASTVRGSFDARWSDQKL